MAEYIEREAAKSEFNLHFGGVSHAVIASKILDEIPAADVVEVVRCKDCKHENVHHAISDKHTWCEYWGIDPDFDDFCSYGERRDNDATD